MLFVMDKPKSKKGASITKEFCLIQLKLCGIYLISPFVRNEGSLMANTFAFSSQQTKCSAVGLNFIDLEFGPDIVSFVKTTRV